MSAAVRWDNSMIVPVFFFSFFSSFFSQLWSGVESQDSAQFPQVAAAFLYVHLYSCAP